MTGAPLFTIVVASHGRGAHILPTLASALGQTIRDFELLVVCDGPDAATAAAVAGVGDARVRLLATDRHMGSQSGPNNLGISAARGRFVAYLGHDDIWAPDHLATLADCFARTGCGVAVGGCAYHGPDGTDLVLVTGMFTDPMVARTQFFPPSSFAHRLDWPGGPPRWHAPETTRAPVDADFLLRAVGDGVSFASTGRLTVHKFSAGHRYLSYMAPASAEQADCLPRLRAGAVEEQALIARAKAAGTFMASVYRDFSLVEPGQLYRENRANKGIDRAAPRPLTGAVEMPVTAEPRALDWYGLERDAATGASWRWSGPSLRPRLLVPFTRDGAARIAILVMDHDPMGLLRAVAITCNGRAVRHVLRRDAAGRLALAFQAPLLVTESSVVQLALPRSYCPADEGQGADARRLGIALMGLSVAPA